MPTSSSSNILSITPLARSGPMPTLDPFLFFVYHKDHYPAGNANMEAPSIGNGADFNPDVPYRMYHGDRIPGFPQHPHRGFETITATIEGIIDHADSLGNAGRYGNGDVQWMTAEMVPPSFAMFWAPDVPQWTSENQQVVVTLWSGALDYFFSVPTGTAKNKSNNNNAPPPNSWAADPSHDVAIWHITLQAGGGGAKLTLPAAKQGSQVNRSLFYVEGDDSTQEMLVDGQSISTRVVLQVKADQQVTLEYVPSNQNDKNNKSLLTTRAAEFLLLQGVPIQEPVAQHGPFVMNSRAEIEQAFRDYQQTQFGGWPWPRDDMVFERTKGRFAKLNGKETRPTENDADGPTCEA